MAQTFLEEALRNATVKSAVVADNQAVAVVVKYIGRGLGELAVSTNGDVYFYRSTLGTSVTLDTAVSGGGSGFIDVSNAAYDTVGEVVDRINTFANWRAMIVDALRSDSSNDTFQARVRTATGVQSTGAHVFTDTDIAAAENLTFTIKQFRNFGRGITAVPSEANWQACLRRLENRIQYTTGTLQYRVYTRDGTTEAEVMRAQAGTTNSGTTINLANGQLDGGVFGNVGGELVVRARGTSTLGNWSNGYLSVEYKNIRRAF